MSPLASVLMTAYNRENYIAEAIESVLAQTFSDFELIIVDDCSADRTYQIAADCSKKDPRVRVFQNQDNLGDYPNRNRAASLACGKYLKYVDSDDVIYPHGLRVMVDGMERFPEAGLGIERAPSKDQPYPIQVGPEAAYREHFEAKGLLNIGPTGAIIRASAFRAVGGFSGKRYVGDTEMWLRLAARWPVVKIAKGLIWWRQHAGQEIVLGQTSLAYLQWDYRVALAALNAPDCPLNPRHREAATRRLKHRQARALLRLALRERKVRDALDVMNTTGFAATDLWCAFARSPRLLV